MTNERKTGKGYSFENEEGRVYLVRCHRCGTENYALSVSSGVCYACGYDANEDEKREEQR